MEYIFLRKFTVGFFAFVSFVEFQLIRSTTIFFVSFNQAGKLLFFIL